MVLTRSTPSLQLQSRRDDGRVKPDRRVPQSLTALIAVPQTSTIPQSAVYLAFDATSIWGFENSDSSSLGFTTTVSMIVFSAGTSGSLSPSAVWATGRTFVSRTNGFCKPLTGRYSMKENTH